MTENIRKKASVINKQDKILIAKTIIKFIMKTIFLVSYHYCWPYKKIRCLGWWGWHDIRRGNKQASSKPCFALLCPFFAFFFSFMFSHQSYRLLHYLNTLWGLLPFYHSGVLVPLLHPKDGKFSCTIPQMKLLCIY